MPDTENEWTRTYIENEIKRLEEEIQRKHVKMAKEVMELGFYTDREITELVNTLVYLKKRLSQMESGE